MNTPGQGQPQGPVNDWQDQNNLYLALSLHWLRLRLTHALPVVAREEPPAPTHAPATAPATNSPRRQQRAAA